ETMFDDPALEPVLVTLLLLGLRVDMLHDIARELHDSYDRILVTGDEPVALPPLDPAPLVAALDAALAWRAVCRDDGDKLARHLEEVAPLRDAIASATDPLDLLEWLDRGLPKKLTHPHGRSANWDGCIEDVKRDLEQAQLLRQRLLDGQRRGVLEVLTARI